VQDWPRWERHDEPVTDEEELRWLREFMARDATELMRRHGAHSLGIGRLVPDDAHDGRLALLFYVDAAESGSGSVQPVPAELEYLPEGRTEPVAVPTRVVESAPAEFE